MMFKENRFLLPFLAVLGMTLFVAFIQFRAPVFFEGDAYYHAAVADFLKQWGPKYPFHWAKFSTFNGNFSDKEFLFHAAIIPFLAL